MRKQANPGRGQYGGNGNIIATYAVLLATLPAFGAQLDQDELAKRIGDRGSGILPRCVMESRLEGAPTKL